MLTRHRYRRDRTLILVLVAIILCGCIAYASTALRTAMELRTRHALDRNLTTAQLSARLMDQQWDDLQSMLSVLVHQSTLEDAIRKNDRKEVARNLRYAVDLVPPLDFAAVYRTDGSLLTSVTDDRYHPSLVPLQNVSHTGWFKAASALRSLYQCEITRLPNDPSMNMIAVAISFGKETKPVGYLLAYYRLGDIEDWLHQLQLSGGKLYIVNHDGELIASSQPRTGQEPNFKYYPPLQMALMHQEGAVVDSDVIGNGKAIVGYAPVYSPQWAVLVIQPFDIAMAATNYPALRLSILGILLLLMLLASTWMIDRLYRHQNRMTHLLAEQNEQLRAADRAKSDFLANVSHDLRTPLASMRVSLSGLLEPDLEWQPEQVRECLRMASEGWIRSARACAIYWRWPALKRKPGLYIRWSAI